MTLFPLQLSQRRMDNEPLACLRSLSSISGKESTRRAPVRELKIAPQWKEAPINGLEGTRGPVCVDTAVSGFEIR